MKRFVRLLAVVPLIILATGATAQVTEEWAARNNSPVDGLDRINAMVVDALGNVYVTGQYATSDCATIKYNSSGVQQWIAIYTPGGPDLGVDVTVDDFGNVYVACRSNQPNYNFVTIKYDSNGTQLWASMFNGPGNQTDRIRAIGVDASGNVYVTGESYYGASQYDYATIKYNSSGAQQWVKYHNGTGNYMDASQDIAVTASGNVYVTGSTRLSDGGDECTTIKYDASGNVKWIKGYSPGVGCEIVLDSSENVYITGVKYGSSAAYDDYLTIVYDSTGTQKWVSTYIGPAGCDRASDIALDPAGNVYVTGLSVGSTTSNDYATVKYDNNGNQQWAARYATPNDDIPEDIATDNEGNVYVTGTLHTYPDSISDYGTVKYDTYGNEKWATIYNGPAGKDDKAYSIAVDTFNKVYVVGGSSNGNKLDYLTIKYNQGFPKDVAPVSIGAPSDTVWLGYSYTPQATVANFQADAVSFPVVCEFDSAGIVVYADTVAITDLAGEDSIQVSFVDWTPGVGTYEMTVTTLLEGDANPGNDQLSKTVTGILPPKDVDVVAINAPEDTVWSAHTYTPQATVANLWEEPQTFNVRCEFDSAGTVVYADTVEVTDLAANDSVQLSFAEWTAGEGNGLSYTMTVTTLLEDDVNPDNDELSKEVTAIWPPRDVAAISIITPPDYVWSGLAHTPRAVVANFWEDPETFDVLCEFDSAGVTIYSDVATVTGLAGGDSTVVEFAPWSAGATDEFTYQMSVTTLLAQDLNPANDTISKLVHAVKAVPDIDIQDYAGNLSANTMELTGIQGSIVVGSYIMVNPDELGNNVDLYDGPGNVDIALSYEWTNLKSYDGQNKIGVNKIDPDLSLVSSLDLGSAAQNIVQVIIGRNKPPDTYVGTITVTGTGEDAVNTDQFTIKVNVLESLVGSLTGFGGEPWFEGNYLYWSNFGFGEKGFNLYRAEPESEEFTMLNTEPMNSTEYLDCDVSVEADYRYKLGLSMGDGRELLIGPLSLTSSPEIGTPVLEQNWPNPWMGATEIRYFLPNNITSATLKVYDISGKLVKTLAQGSHEPGPHSVIWNGKDEYDRSVSSGIYFYILRTDDQQQTKKMLLLR